MKNQQEIAAMIDKALNPDGNAAQHYAFVALVIEQPPPGTNANVPAAVASNLPLDTQNNRVASLLRSAALQIENPMPPGLEDQIMPPEFWRKVTKAEMKRVWANDGILDAKLCKKLWRILGRTDKPPQRLEVLINKDDLERHLAKEKQ